MYARVKPCVWLGLALAACVISWTYMHRVEMPWETYVNVTTGRLKAQLGDLYPRWVGTRELLLYGHDPYGPEVSHEIQTAFYGHPIVQTYDRPAEEIVDEQRFAYPIYVVFLLAPTVHVEFAPLQMWMPVVIGAFVAISIWLWTRIVHWHASPLILVSLVLFVLCSPQIAQGLRLRQFGLLVASLIALAAWCVTRDRYAIAGALLALSTIKPQIVLLIVVWFLLWSLGDPRRRWPVVAGFGCSLGLLGGLGALLLPRWPIEFLRGIEAYRHYFPITSPIRFALGDWMGGGLSIVIVLVLFVSAWRKRKCAPHSSEFAETLALFLLVTTLVLPLMTPNNQVLLLLPMILLLRDWDRLPRAGRIAFGILVAWPWVASLVMLVHSPSTTSPSRLPLLPSSLVLFFPFLIAALLFVRSQLDQRVNS